MNTSKYLLFHGGQKSTLMTFDTTKAGSAATHLILPFVSTGTYACTIFWGDGTSIYVNAYDDARLDHTYGVAGTYDVEIVGQCWGWRYNNAGDKLKITAIKRWGTQFRLGNNSACFFGCANLTIPATDTLDMTGTLDFDNIFRDCSSIVTVPSFSTLDTSLVTDMSGMFAGCTAFNQVLIFDTSSVITMESMFAFCSVFNSSVAGIATSSAASMDTMFRSCLIFDQSLATFDLTSLTDASNMFLDSNALSTANYDALLISWAAQTVQPNVPFHAGDATYTNLAEGTNLVTNGDFENGTTGWAGYNCTISDDSEKAKVLFNATNSPRIYQTVEATLNNKYYLRCLINVNKEGISTNTYLSLGVGITGAANAVTIAGDIGTTQRTISGIVDGYLTGTNYFKIAIDLNGTQADGVDYSLIDDIFVVDLTALYGAGSEPTLEWCDANLPSAAFDAHNVLTNDNGWTIIDGGWA